MFDARFLAGVLFSALLTASGLSWLRWGLRPEQFGGPASVPVDPEVAESAAEVIETQPMIESETGTVTRTPWPPMAIFAALFWVAFMVLDQTRAEVIALTKSVEVAPAVTESAENVDTKAKMPSSPPTFNTTPLIISMIMGCAVFVGLGLLLFASGKLRPDDVGITADDWPTQFAWGQQAFLAAVIPTFALLAATIFFRHRETQHPFLQMVANAPEEVPLLMMFFITAVIAPLSEELVFRVTLQGWLTEQWHARGAIITTAIIFAFVHGWRDGIALIPLALILGYLYHVRRSYLAVVTAHGLFNAANLALALLSALGSAEATG